MSESLLSLCTRIACEAHAGQVDKAGEPYIFHVMRVAMAVEGEEAKAVALLHDVVEDTEVTHPVLWAYGFSEEICSAVIAITRYKDQETYAEYIERVALNPLARVVKLADLADNLRP